MFYDAKNITEEGTKNYIYTTALAKEYIEQTQVSPQQMPLKKRHNKNTIVQK